MEETTANARKKGGNGCLVAFCVASGLSLFLTVIVLSIVAAVCAGIGSAASADRGQKLKFKYGEKTAEEDNLPRLVWERGGKKDSPSVLRLRLNGTIAFGGDRTDFWGMRERSPGEMLLKRIREATLDEEVKGIYLELDTPGGEVTAADVLHESLLQFKDADTNRFVVVHMGSICCSGGYYVAAAADCIVAHPTTTTGSIGVILSTVNAAELAKKVGVESVSIATGENKNLLDPLKPVDPGHVEIFRKVIDEDYERFVSIVAEGRGISVADVKKIADGRILSAREACDLKLVDAIGYREDAYEILCKYAGEDVRICRYEDDASLRGLLSEILAVRSPSRIATEAVKALIPGASAPTLEYRLR